MLVVAMVLSLTAIGASSLFRLALRAVMHTEVRGPARWSEMSISMRDVDAICPDEIAALAHRVLCNQTGRLTMYYGELRQDTVVLDPYLLVRDALTNEVLILGVWKDDEILYLAG